MKPIKVIRYRAAPSGVSPTTWNPLDKDAAIALSAGNRTAAKSSGSSDKGVRTASEKSSGKWVLAIRIDASTNVSMDIGLATAMASLGSYLGADSGGWAYDGGNGKIYHAGSSRSYGSTYAAGDVIEILYDADAGQLRFTKNGTVQASGTAAATGLVGPLFAAVSMSGSGTAMTIQTGSSSGWAVSNGYLPWD